MNKLETYNDAIEKLSENALYYNATHPERAAQYREAAAWLVHCKAVKK
jgi:hypothetical protein